MDDERIRQGGPDGPTEEQRRRKGPQQEKEPPIQKGPHFGWGVLLCIVLTAAVLFFGGWIFCAVTGQTILFGRGGVSVLSGSGALDDAETAKIEELCSYIEKYYYKDIDAQQMAEGIYHGLLSSLGDPYSAYYTAEEYEQTKATTTGTYYGIGASLMQDTQTMQVTVTAVYAGSPAEEAGLLPKDQILFVEDIEAAVTELNDLVTEIRGREGTYVSLTVYRPDTDETFPLSVERRDVTIPTVSAQMLTDEIAYLQITEFQEATDEQFAESLKELKEAGMTSIVIDLRDNPGGVLDVVVDILDRILPEGLLVYVEDKYGSRTDYTSNADCLSVPMVVLVNENSASASEIFAGAVKDYEWGTILGTTTYGKGIVQTLFPLSDGDAVKLTTAKYFTPSGKYIQDLGIEPDVEMPYEYTGPDEEAYDMAYDSQIQAAVELLLGEQP